MTPTPSQPLCNYPTIPLTFSAWIRPDAAAVSRPFATAVARTHEDYAFQDFWLGLIKRQARLHDSLADEGRCRRQRRRAGRDVDAHRLHVRAFDGDATLYVNGVYAASI